MECISLWPIVLGDFTLMIAMLSVRAIAENQRAVVFRSGQYHRIAGPGVILTIPFLESTTIIDIEGSISQGRNLSEQDLRNVILHRIGIQDSLTSNARGVEQRLKAVFDGLRLVMDPGFELGIRHIRIRGLVRILASIVLTAAFVLLALGGFTMLGSIGTHDPDERGIDIVDIVNFLLLGFPLILIAAASIHFLWGFVESLLGRSWNSIRPSLRLLLMAFIGIPQVLLILAGIFYLGSEVF